MPFGAPAKRAIERWLEVRPGDDRSPGRSAVRRRPRRAARLTHRLPARREPCSPSSRAPARQARTPSGTPRQRTSSTAEPTSARCRRCSATPASAPPSSTPTSPARSSRRPTASPTPAPDGSGRVGSSTARGITPRNRIGDTYCPSIRTPTCTHITEQWPASTVPSGCPRETASPRRAQTPPARSSTAPRRRGRSRAPAGRRPRPRSARRQPPARPRPRPARRDRPRDDPRVRRRRRDVRPHHIVRPAHRPHPRRRREHRDEQTEDAHAPILRPDRTPQTPAHRIRGWAPPVDDCYHRCRAG